MCVLWNLKKTLYVSDGCSLVHFLFNCLLFIADVVNSSDQPKNHQVPEWAQQEVSHCPLTKGMLENWFPQSDKSGVSSHLMESMR